MISYPLITLAVGSDAGEDVEAGFEPIVPALGDFNGFVFLMVGGICAVGGGFAAHGGEVAVQFDHGVAGGDGVGAVDLDFVVSLGAAGGGE